eukprot:m.173953 g.173953  ORF g.173953 m.173953 type:complete len:66 (-) comp25264_c0_seq3:387-584(-)
MGGQEDGAGEKQHIRVLLSFSPHNLVMPNTYRCYPSLMGTRPEMHATIFLVNCIKCNPITVDMMV